MPNLTGVTNYFTKAAENTAAMTLASSIAAGATTVPLSNSNVNYNDGDVVTFVIEPTSATNKQVFTGTMLGGSVTNVIWTFAAGGSNVPHASGASVVDYVTATDWDMLTTGVQKSLNQNGSLKTAAVQAALNGASTGADWNNLGTVPTIAATQGQHEIQATFTGVNYTDRLQLGTRLQFPRTSTPPTQSMSFTASSSQYASKASPVNMGTNWTAFTIETQIYLPAYTSGNEIIIGRQDSGVANGWSFYLDSGGHVHIVYASAGNFTDWRTAQALSMGRWLHIAGVVSNTATKSLQGLYIDGVQVQTVAVNTNAAALTQAGSLAIGANGIGGTVGSYGTFSLSETRVWAAAQSQAQILANKDINLTGTETNLVALYPGNGVWTDKTANANTLTPSGGATFTTNVPFSPSEYGVVTSISYTSGNTVCKVFGGPYNIPVATVGTTSYSSAGAPFGMNVDKSKWTVETTMTTSLSVSSPATNTAYDLSFYLALPIGSFRLVLDCDAFSQRNGTAGDAECLVVLCDTVASLTPLNGDQRFMKWLYSTTTGFIIAPTTIVEPVSFTTYKTIVVSVFAGLSGLSGIGIRGDRVTAVLRAECAWI